MKKRIFKFLILSFMIFLLTSCAFFGTIRWNLNNQYNIDLPSPISEKLIFDIEFRDGQKFVVFKYDMKQKNEIIKEYNFKRISSDNIDEIKKMAEEFYSILNENNKKLFDETVKKEDLIKYGNYYLIKYKPYDRFVILVFNDNYLYYCNKI